MTEYDPNQPVLIHPSFPPQGEEKRAHEGSQSQAPLKYERSEDAPYMYSPSYRQGREALRTSRIVRPELAEQE